MKKRILSIILALALTIGTCSITVAAERGGATRNSLKSYGSIEYHKGNDKVIINSEDLYMLADQIDQVKLEVADQLEAMNTYFTAGDGISLDTDRYISVTHTRPSRADFVDPVSVNFDTLLEGIAASQSVSSDVSDYGYSPGTKLYKGANGELTTNSSEEGAKQISVSAATANNLSAGTVAWVNGRLILGTGGDNKAYFDSGYSSGEDNKTDEPSTPSEPSDGFGTGGEENTIKIKGTYTFQEDMDLCYLLLARDSSENYVGAPAVNLISGQVIMTKIVGFPMYNINKGSAYVSVYRLTNIKKDTVISTSANLGGRIFK